MKLTINILKKGFQAFSIVVLKFILEIRKNFRTINLSKREEGLNLKLTLNILKRSQAFFYSRNLVGWAIAFIKVFKGGFLKKNENNCSRINFEKCQENFSNKSGKNY